MLKILSNVLLYLERKKKVNLLIKTIEEYFEARQDHFSVHTIFEKERDIKNLIKELKESNYLD